MVELLIHIEVLVINSTNTFVQYSGSRSVDPCTSCYDSGQTAAQADHILVFFIGGTISTLVPLV